MASVNKVHLLGNVGRDPELRYATSGKAICNVSIATTSRYKKDGQQVEETQWHRVTFYDRLAEIAGEYVKKGQPIYVEGRLKYGKFTNKDGHEQNTVDIMATELQLLGGREEKPSQAPQRPSHDAARARQLPKQDSGFDDMDDDIPF